ncbi:hypothetical protein ACP4OV_026963 [Aristida adscensionis]
MATKPSSSSFFSFLKDALLLPTRNPKLFVPVFLLVAIPTILINVTNVLAIQPLTQDIMLRINEIKNVDPSSPEYARLMEEMMKELRALVIIAIAMTIIVAVLGFVKQIVAFFAASSTYSGDRYSLLELVTKVIMSGHRLRGPVITIALVGALDVACVMLLVSLLQLLMRQSSMAFAFLLLLPAFAAFLYINVFFTVAVAVSVADEGRRGVGALRQAWRLMTQARRKEGCVLVVVVHLLGAAPSPLYAVALGLAKRSVAMGLALLVVYALISAAVQLFYMAAAMVYCHQAMETKTATANDFGYIKIPTGEANA